MNDSTDKQWLSLFPELKDVADPAWHENLSFAQHVSLPENTVVFKEGEPCEKYIFVIDGRTRVFKTFESGREIVLYRLRAGQTCSLTTSVLLAGGAYPATAKTEAPTDAVILPAAYFHRAFDQCQPFRQYVCGVFGGRIREMIMLLEAVTFRRIDIRLARWLLSHHDDERNVEASHRELAFELGTAREVVSRQLKKFEDQGWVSLGRKSITLTNAAGLEELIHSLHA